MGSTFWHRKPVAKFCTASLLLSVCILFVPITPQKTTSLVERTLINADSKPDSYHQRNENIHILLPATKRDVNLCKTLLTMTILDYPDPSIVGWGAVDTTDHMRGGGSHYIKIERVLEYLNMHEHDSGFDDELVLVLDSYDVWFQLPLHVLINRYYFAIAEENARTAQRMGRAYEEESVDSLVLFGAGKRCRPNQRHTATCHVIPESPLPHDLYGNNTDTAMGYNQWTSSRTRYLNSGYMIGPARSMRALLQRAQDKLDVSRNRTEAAFDDGSGKSDFCYHGSDQSIFAEMYGDQEHHRDLMRQYHESRWDRLVSSFRSKRKDFTWQAESDIGHEYLAGKPYEFGITLDYWSSIGHQTMNAQHDAKFLRYNESDTDPLARDSELDCQMTRPELEESLDKDLWAGRPLYSEVCLTRVFPGHSHYIFGDVLISKDIGPSWWLSIVEQYSKCELTYDQDRLKAFTGIAKLYQEFHNETYMFGHFVSMMPQSLMWQIQSPRRSSGEIELLRQRLEYVAPSWSWACVNGPIYVHSRIPDTLVTFIDSFGGIRNLGTGEVSRYTGLLQLSNSQPSWYYIDLEGPTFQEELHRRFLSHAIDGRIDIHYFLVGHPGLQLAFEKFKVSIDCHEQFPLSVNCMPVYYLRDAYGLLLTPVEHDIASIINMRAISGRPMFRRVGTFETGGENWLEFKQDERLRYSHNSLVIR